MKNQITEWARELQSLAQAGLYYGRDVFDRERYERIRQIAAEMMAEQTNLPLEKVKDLFCADSGYQTPKIDTRSAIFEDGKILLVRERTGKWALPGGWCEYNLSPAENAVKEAREEAGLETEPVRLIAVQDRKKHNRPEYVYDVVKIFILCRKTGGEFKNNTETTGSEYFAEGDLPAPLAEEKTTREQIRMCFEASKDENWRVQFD